MDHKLWYCTLQCTGVFMKGIRHTFGRLQLDRQILAKVLGAHLAQVTLAISDITEFVRDDVEEHVNDDRVDEDAACIMQVRAILLLLNQLF